MQIIIHARPSLKFLFVIVGWLFQMTSFAQKSNFLSGIDFDSSYSIIGLGQGHPNVNDSLQGFWFILDNPDDMNKLKREWVFKKVVNPIQLEDRFIEVYVVRNKQLINPGTLIFPRQGVIESGITWYRFDTSVLSHLHRQHPLKYHSQLSVFDTQAHFASYGNSILNDSSLLFFLPFSGQYEGKFSITAKRTSDPDSQIFALSYINKELAKLAPDNTYHSYLVNNDPFNMEHTDKVRITVECTKNLYDKYQSKTNIKEAWEPTLIDVKTFWRD
jgi:hypothetical protein